MSDSESGVPADEPTGTPGDAAADQTAAAPVVTKAEKPRKPAEPHQSAGRVIRETVMLLVFAVVLALGVKTFFVQSFYIPSPSMEPGLVKNDRILVEKPSYWFGGPERGDVIVFEDPGDWLNGLESPAPSGPIQKGLAKIGLFPSGGHLVKRVIGTEGDVIKCCDDEGRIMVNGVAIDGSDFLKATPNRTNRCDGPQIPSCDWTAGPVPKDSLFVMGDNRYNSADSSAHLCRNPKSGCNPTDGFVKTDLVVGKVFALVWPLGRFTILHRPSAFDDVPDPS